MLVAMNPRWLVLLLALLLGAGCGRRAGAPDSALPSSVARIVVWTASSQDEAEIREPSEGAVAGDVFVEAGQGESETHLTVSGARAGAPILISRRRITRRTEILAVQGTKVVRWKLTFLEYARLSTFDGREFEHPLPTTGKTYVIDVTRGTPSITDDSGRQIAGKEREAVLAIAVTNPRGRRSENPRPRDAAPGRRELPVHRARLGDDVSWYSEYIENQIALQSLSTEVEAEVTGATLESIGEVDGDVCAIVRFEMRLHVTEADGNYEDTLGTGETLVRASDGETLAMTFRGRTTSQGRSTLKGGGEVTFRGAGTRSWILRRKWEKRGSR